MKLHLIGLESIETRYTKEWKDHLPKVLSKHFTVVDDYYGDQLDADASPGGFLNWTSTQYFKSSQMLKIAEAFQSGKIQANDVIFFADFWNPALLQTRYISDMAGIPVKIVALAHAGAYDPWDQVAQKTNKWAVDAERGMAAACDMLFFATQFHLDLFLKTHPWGARTFVAGFPFEYIKKDWSGMKTDTVLFTQRNAPEKQPELFEELEVVYSDRYPNRHLKFVNVQSLGCSKEEYHQHLREAKLVVSFALQETLGITPFEALAFNCDILVPDRLSYSEMYSAGFVYPSGATVNDIADLVYEKIATFNENSEERLGEFYEVGSLFFCSDHLTGLISALTA